MSCFFPVTGQKSAAGSSSVKVKVNGHSNQMSSPVLFYFLLVFSYIKFGMIYIFLVHFF